jgi:hypothetical protein
MSELGEKLAEHVAELINTLEELACEQPQKYFHTPYQTLHDRLAMALESYQNASTNRLPHALQKPPQTGQIGSGGGE